MISSFRPQARLFHPQSSRKLIAMLGIAVLAGLAFSASQALAADSLARQDKSFLTDAAHAGHAEIDASKLALEKSSNPAVKSFAEKMIADHGKVGDELKALAASKNVSVPDEPGMAQKAKIAILGKLQGPTFDKQYAGMIGVSAHKDAVSLFKKTAAGAKDADIKQFAASNLPGLQEHLEMATQLKASVDAEK